MAENTLANGATAVREGGIDDRTLVIERVFKAPPQKVFEAWTNPEILVKWWGPDGSRTPDHGLDVREGGKWRTVMVSAEGEAHTASGVYREIKPPRRLVMTWGWEQPDGTRGHETIVEITLDPAPGGTRLKLVQRLFQNVEQREGHKMGWDSSFNALDRLLA